MCSQAKKPLGPTVPKRPFQDAFELWGANMYQRSHEYKYIGYVGTVPVQPQPLTAKCELKPNRIFEHTNSEFKNFVNSTAGDYVVSNSTAEHLHRSIIKIDAPVCHEFRNHGDIVAKALSFVGDMYDEAFRAREMTDMEVQEETIMDRSAGVISAFMGLPKKGDCLRAGLHNSFYKQPDTNQLVLWKVSGKRELRTRHDYVDLFKQRTFIIEPFEHLWSTKKAYGMQNKGLMMEGWSCYGHNPYSGGVTRLARRLTKHKRFWILDGKGWDRLLSCMREVYILRNKYKVIDDHLRWVYENLIDTFLMLPNGDVIFKTWGNNSGSGNTTGDNIIAMTFVLSFLFFYMGYTRPEILSMVEVAIFGDDVVGSDSLPCSDEELEVGFRVVFTDMFGIVLDPFEIHYDLERCTFLGYHFGRVNASWMPGVAESDAWVPKYDLSRLCAAVRGNDDTMEFRAELAKLSSLMLMSAGHGKQVYDLFKRAVLDVIYSSDDEFAEKLREQDENVIVPTYDDIIDWYLGFEGEIAPLYSLSVLDFSL